jgi:hypothetical protein
MLTNDALSVWRSLLAGVVVGAIGLSLMACSSSSTNQAATTEPVLHAFVGRFADQPDLKVALLVGRDSSVAYICDNHSGAEFLRGSARQHGPGGTVELRTDDGTTLDASFGAQDATGTVTLPGRPAARFTARLTNGAAGLYEASAAVEDGRLQGRWIVGNDGQVAGAAKLNGVPVGNPSLQPTVKVGTGTLTPLAVRLLPTTQPRQRPPVPAGSVAGRTALASIPVIDNAFSLPCGDFHVIGSGFAPHAPVQVSLLPAVRNLGIQVSPQLIAAYQDGSIASDLAYRLSTKPMDHNNNVQVYVTEYPGAASAQGASMNAYAC